MSDNDPTWMRLHQLIKAQQVKRPEWWLDLCGYAWGEHACSLPPGHIELHQCPCFVETMLEPDQERLALRTALEEALREDDDA